MLIEKVLYLCVFLSLDASRRRPTESLSDDETAASVDDWSCKVRGLQFVVSANGHEELQESSSTHSTHAADALQSMLNR